MVGKLANRQIEEIKIYFKKYKKDSKWTTKKIAKMLDLDKTTIQKRFRRLFGEEYINIAKRRSIHNIKLNDKDINLVFKRYAKGEFLINLAKEYNINRDALTTRLRKIIGSPYKNLAKVRRVRDASINRQKVTDDKIRKAFVYYKNNKISLTKLAESLGLRESSLISRFKHLFGKSYKRIAKERRDERKVTNEQYVLAFDRYCKTDISLVQLSEELNIRISSLAPKFRRLFGQKYKKIASRKMDLIEVNRKGKIAEEIAQKYLKKVGIEFEDVRRRCSLEGSLKKPDFIAGNFFIEVKNYYVNLSSSKRVKGYAQIKESYLGKKVKKTKQILDKGIIISLTGFSNEVINEAKKDRILLVGPEDIKRVLASSLPKI